VDESARVSITGAIRSIPKDPRANIAPPNVPGSTGSPANPLAMF
jgi:hypothetical protein